mgnify:CR=1 FL=1
MKRHTTLGFSLRGCPPAIKAQKMATQVRFVRFNRFQAVNRPVQRVEWAAAEAELDDPTSGQCHAQHHAAVLQPDHIRFGPNAGFAGQ